MNRTNRIISIAILALGLGVMPQAQGMGYFKSAYHSACSWGKKAVNSALVVKSQSMARIATIVNHIVPQTPKNSVNSDVSINRINTIVNHIQPEQKTATLVQQDHNALKRAQMIVNHLAPVTEQPNICVNNCDSKPQKPGLKERFNEMYQWYYQTIDPNTLAQFEIASEEILDSNDALIATIKFYRKSLYHKDPLFVQLFDKNGELVGFCISCINAFSKVGFIADLHVSQNERRNGYGKILLAYTTKKLYEFGCPSIQGTASSHDLKAGENQDHMQTKLEGFYGQFGAESRDGSKVNLGVTIQ